MEKLSGGVGFFDSGIGGLTVLAECRKYIKDEIFYYYGDNDHAPYGNLSFSEIEKLVFSAFDMFARLNVKATVIACNTATAVCVEKLRKIYPFPIVGAEPAILPAMKKGGLTYVLTTRATYNSMRFQNLCARICRRFPKSTLQAYPCDGLAGEIEKHLCDSNYDYTPCLPQGTPDTVVLGCTHYIYLKKQIRRFYRSEVVDGNQGMANRLISLLKEYPNENRETQPLLATPPKNAPIFFLGTQKTINEHVYEQTFAKMGNFCNKSG